MKRTITFQILIQKIQNTIDEILDDPVVSKDLFDLPKDALTFILCQNFGGQNCRFVEDIQTIL